MGEESRLIGVAGQQDNVMSFQPDGKLEACSITGIVRFDSRILCEGGHPLWVKLERRQILLR